MHPVARLLIEGKLRELSEGCTDRQRARWARLLIGKKVEELVGAYPRIGSKIWPSRIGTVIDIGPSYHGIQDVVIQLPNGSVQLPVDSIWPVDDNINGILKDFGKKFDMPF